MIIFAIFLPAFHLSSSSHTLRQFLAQELSNTAWALATLHSKRGSNTPTEAVEDDGIVRILRWAAKFLIQRVDSYKPQELSNR